MPKDYRVESQIDDDNKREYSYVCGLPEDKLIRQENGSYADVTTFDTRLMHINEYGEPSFVIKNRIMMMESLYDLFQTHGDLNRGDRFLTKFGNFVCRDVHVLPEDNEPI